MISFSCAALHTHAQTYEDVSVFLFVVWLHQRRLIVFVGGRWATMERAPLDKHQTAVPPLFYLFIQ